MTSNPWPDRCCLDEWQTNVSAAQLQVEACVYQLGSAINPVLLLHTCYLPPSALFMLFLVC